MARISRETFNFTQDFQNLILACVLKRPEFAKYAAVIKPMFFTGSVSTLTARAIFDYHKKRQTYPSEEVLLQLVADEAKKQGDDSNDLAEYVTKLFKIKTSKEWEEVHEKVLNFCRERMVLRALTLSVDHFKEGTQPEGGYVKLFEEAVAVGVELEDTFQFNPEEVLEDREPTLTLAGRTICSPGNISTVAGLPKAGKSAVVGAVLATLISSYPDDCLDCLGFVGNNPKGLPVIHFDCEHSKADYHKFMDGVLKRSGLSRKTFPRKKFLSYHLKTLSAEQRVAMMKRRIGDAYDQCGGIALVVLDTVTDFCHGVNDDKKSEAFIGELCALADKFDTSILSIIHFNPVTQKGASTKMRGHLGSELARKSESNLTLKKEIHGEEEITTITANENRQGGIAGVWAPCFKYDAELRLHVTCDTPVEAKRVAKIKELEELAAAIFVPDDDGPAALRHKDLVDQIMDHEECKERTAKTRVTELVKSGLIKKGAKGTYFTEEES